MKKKIGIAVIIVIASIGTAGLALASDDERDERDGHERHEGHERREGHEEHERAGEHRGRGKEHSRPAAALIDPETRALYRKECGACHLDFPPHLLPAASHRRTMAELERHFGQSAELEPDVRDEPALEAVANAADAGAKLRAGGAAAEAPRRISELPWFQSEHRRVDAQVKAQPSIGTIANCAACHPAAASWVFDEKRAKIQPR
jgi:hypothetical protein